MQQQWASSVEKGILASRHHDSILLSIIRIRIGRASIRLFIVLIGAIRTVRALTRLIMALSRTIRVVKAFTKLIIDLLLVITRNIKIQCGTSGKHKACLWDLYLRQ